jgi:hypothetical protein
LCLAVRLVKLGLPCQVLADLAQRLTHVGGHLGWISPGLVPREELAGCLLNEWITRFVSHRLHDMGQGRDVVPVASGIEGQHGPRQPVVPHMRHNVPGLGRAHVRRAQLDHPADVDLLDRQAVGHGGPGAGVRLDGRGRARRANNVLYCRRQLGHGVVGYFRRCRDLRKLLGDADWDCACQGGDDRRAENR